MSDLQCAATFLLVPADVEPSGLERALAHDRVAEVRTAAHPDAVRLARALAAAWGLPGPARSDLDASSYHEVLTDLADLRRGETTLVVVEPEVLALLAGAGPAPALLEVRVDADGWVVRDRSAPRGGPAAFDPTTR